MVSFAHIRAGMHTLTPPPSTLHVPPRRAEKQLWMKSVVQAKEEKGNYFHVLLFFSSSLTIGYNTVSFVLVQEKVKGNLFKSEIQNKGLQ